MHNTLDNFDIGITTFSLRFNYAENLVKKIRGLGITNNILLCINGEKDGLFKEDYRKNILALCQDYVNVFPIFFVEMRGLSKMWNTLTIHSTKQDILLLNDDIELHTSNMFDVVSAHITSTEYTGLSIINNTYSFFVVNKRFLDDLGYFDERLLGFGEEDGDIGFRVRKQTGQPVHRLYVSGVDNLVSDIRHTHVTPGIGKYSLFNRNFIFNQKYKCDGNIYYFPDGIECEEIVPTAKLYPYEKFFHENKVNL